ncbi:hypothetical protein AGDE_14432 [Angomonas deanei]|uniref:Uncharacterized protein n=1 Tax=Angomonas deanei TaxID=59799 RepID=A0A7G2CQ27_9TRYP|nr:hypothetical protein AGDE_14432 [Angomonas deanei]CAD2221217.1 hypothetical protein, conserved [Angomonas deanei]|eukprot:EPY20835.1 hypothetical protein AGDE_14432 [Angomonas deanei]
MREAVRANKEKLEAKKEDYTNPLLGETDVGSEQSGTSKGKKDKTTSREAPTPWDQKKGEETIVVFENPLKKKEPTILAKGTALRDGERDPLNFNTLYGMRVVVLRRRNYMRERQIMYQVELLAFVGDTNRSRRRVMKFRKKEEKYMRALNAS